MARNVTTESRKVPENDKNAAARRRNTLIAVRVYAGSAEDMDTIVKVLNSRAQDGLNVPGVRVELGKAHMWGVAVQHLAKELGVEL